MVPVHDGDVRYDFPNDWRDRSDNLADQIRADEVSKPSAIVIEELIKCANRIRNHEAKEHVAHQPSFIKKVLLEMLELLLEENI